MYIPAVYVMYYCTQTIYMALCACAVNLPEEFPHSLANAVEDVRESIYEWKRGKCYSSSCPHVDVIIVQYGQGRPKQTEQYYGFRDVVVGFLVWLYKADY